MKGLASPILALGVLLAVVPIMVKLIDPGAKYTIWGHRLGFAAVVAAVPAVVIILGALHTMARGFLSRASSFLPADIFAGPVRSGAMAESSRSSDDVLHDPLYQARSGYLYLLQHDVSEVLKDVVEAGWDVVVFIDDLDRCGPKTTGEVFEAINIFLAQLFIGARFVLGIDPVVVASHIDVAFKDMPAETSMPLGDDPSPGWTFLRKLIQMPVILPRITDEAVGNLLRSVFDQDVDKFVVPLEPHPELDVVTTGRVEPGGLAKSAVRDSSEVGTVEESRFSGSAEISVLSSTPRLVPVSVLEQDPQVLTLIRDRLSAQPTRSAREAKRILTVWQFFVRVSERVEPMGGTDAIERAKSLVILAEILVRWPAIQGHLMRRASSGVSTLGLLASAASDDSRWVDALSQALLDGPSFASSLANLRYLLRECGGESVAQLADLLC